MTKDEVMKTVERVFEAAVASPIGSSLGLCEPCEAAIRAEASAGYGRALDLCPACMELVGAAVRARRGPVFPFSVTLKNGFLEVLLPGYADWIETQLGFSDAGPPEGWHLAPEPGQKVLPFGWVPASAKLSPAELQAMVDAAPTKERAMARLGDRVRTAVPLTATDEAMKLWPWDDKTIANRRAGAFGKIFSWAHWGARVEHDDGTAAGYAMNELTKQEDGAAAPSIGGQLDPRASITLGPLTIFTGGEILVSEGTRPSEIASEVLATLEAVKVAALDAQQAEIKTARTVLLAASASGSTLEEQARAALAEILSLRARVSTVAERLVKEREAYKAVLRALEWSGRPDAQSLHDACPLCEGYKPNHDLGCALAALIAPKEPS